MNQDIRVRMAPSPTGFLHIGTARTAIFNWLFARHEGGQFVLRIEDTDRERSEKRYEDDIVEGLRWLGIDWDEFYRQSDRTQIYTKYLETLLDEGKAFWCYHTPEELETERQEQLAAKDLPRHVCGYKTGRDGGSIEDRTGIIRLKVDEDSERKISFEDMIRGHIEFEERLLGDFSIAKSLSEPLYNLAVVIDDYEMNISHVIRGEDHIANTPRQILLQEALGFTPVTYAHLPLILAPDRSKLSKRHGAVSLNEYRQLGYVAGALFNYLSLLGFTAPTDKEILSHKELAEVFDLAKVHRSGAIFDIKKLDWLNGEYIKGMSDTELAEALRSFLPEDFGNPETEYLLKILPLMRERLVGLAGCQDFDYLFKAPTYDRGLLIWKTCTAEEVRESLQRTLEIIKSEILDEQSLRKALDDLGRELGDRGLVYWPLRVALSGKKASPDPIQIALVLSRDEVVQRIESAISKFTD